MELTMHVPPTAPNDHALDLVLPPESDDPSDHDACAVPHERVARAAFLIAEARGFASGAELDDWLAAEQSLQGLPPISHPA
jgi:hypothetical protein